MGSYRGRRFIQALSVVLSRIRSANVPLLSHAREEGVVGFVVGFHYLLVVDARSDEEGKDGSSSSNTISHVISVSAVQQFSSR